ncbi:MAG: TIGR02996 domain-containing protein, partial [Gemmataceae bacterium]
MPSDLREQLAVFLRAIKHDPGDDVPRLVLADWLQDQGDPRGELLALEVEIDRLAESDPRRERLRRRERLLLDQYGTTWLGPLVDLPLTWRFERGFPHLEAHADRFL